MVWWNFWEPGLEALKFRSIVSETNQTARSSNTSKDKLAQQHMQYLSAHLIAYRRDGRRDAGIPGRQTLAQPYPILPIAPRLAHAQPGTKSLGSTGYLPF